MNGHRLKSYSHVESPLASWVFLRGPTDSTLCTDSQRVWEYNNDSRLQGIGA